MFWLPPFLQCVTLQEVPRACALLLHVQIWDTVSTPSFLSGYHMNSFSTSEEIENSVRFFQLLTILLDFPTHYTTADSSWQSTFIPYDYMLHL